MSVGNQIVSIIYFSQASSGNVNKRHKGVRQTGIYSGGYLSIVEALPPCSASLHPLICEITDGTHQVRVETTIAVDINVSSANPYIVLRWNYTGAITDYVEILATNSPLINDLIVGLCSFDGANKLQGFDYSERTTPNVQNLFLRVEAPDVSMTNKMKVRVRAGRIHTATGIVKISDPETPSPFTHSGGGSTEYGLVYVDTAGNVQIVNASGNTTIPSFAGRLVLAIVAITAATTVITQSMITDVRPFLVKQIVPDKITIDFDSNGKLYLKSIPSALVPLVVPAKVDSILGAWTNLDSLGSVFVVGSTYKVTSDGFIVAYDGVAKQNSTVIIYTDGNNPSVTKRMNDYNNATGQSWGFCIVRKGDYWKVTGTATVVFWLPIGNTGQCVKQ